MSLSLPALYGPILSAAQKCAELPTMEDATQVYQLYPSAVSNTDLF